MKLFCPTLHHQFINAPSRLVFYSSEKLSSSENEKTAEAKVDQEFDPDAYKAVETYDRLKKDAVNHLAQYDPANISQELRKNYEQADLKDLQEYAKISLENLNKLPTPTQISEKLAAQKTLDLTIVTNTMLEINNIIDKFGDKEIRARRQDLPIAETLTSTPQIKVSGEKITKTTLTRESLAAGFVDVDKTINQISPGTNKVLGQTEPLAPVDKQALKNPKKFAAEFNAVTNSINEKSPGTDELIAKSGATFESNSVKTTTDNPLAKAPKESKVSGETAASRTETLTKADIARAKSINTVIGKSNQGFPYNQ